MNYDLPGYSAIKDKFGEPWPILSFVDLENCCALSEACYFPLDKDEEADDDYDPEQECWTALCELAAHTKPSFFTLSEDSQQTMINLVEACPDVTPLTQIPSRQGNYMVNLYLFQK